MTRSRPASASACGGAGQAEPLVVSEISGAGRARAVRRDDVDQAAAQQRLAAGEAHLGDAEPLDRDADQPDDLVVGEQLVVGQPVQALGRHAVRAAQVAAVGQRDPQVGRDPAEAVARAALVTRTVLGGRGPSTRGVRGRAEAVTARIASSPCGRCGSWSSRRWIALRDRRRAAGLRSRGGSASGSSTGSTTARRSNAIVERNEAADPVPGRATCWRPATRRRRERRVARGRPRPGTYDVERHRRGPLPHPRRRARASTSWCRWSPTTAPRCWSTAAGWRPTTAAPTPTTYPRPRRAR